jgi:ubiquinone/menaquinone biosynthesis C-methylase UbiE
MLTYTGMPEETAQQFGSLARDYAIGRKRLPADAMTILASLLCAHKLNILDLGCCTGISTRQFAEGGHWVVGTDIDRKMLERALEEYANNVSYALGSAEQIPFTDQHFDAVVCVSAFHWFANSNAVSEIERILKPRGLLIIINKYDADGLRKKYKSIVQMYARKSLPSIKQSYKPAELLKRLKWSDVRTRWVEYTENYTETEAVSYFKSLHFWNYVPRESRKEANRKIRKLINETTNRGHLVHRVKFRIVVARKA